MIEQRAYSRTTERWHWWPERLRWQLTLLSGVALTAAGALGCAPASADSTTSGAPILKQARIQPQLGERVPLDLQFRDAMQGVVRLEDFLQRRPVVLHLVYFECPMLCKLAEDGLLRGLRGMDLSVGSQFEVLTVSFDPRETAELAARAKSQALEQYGRAGAAEAWHFLTGDAENIERLTEAVGFHPVWDDATAQYAHPSGVFVLSADGMISRYLSGIDFRPRDLRLAIVEASEGKISSVSDQLLMLCYQYDPTTGRYGLAIMTLLRASGLFTVAVLVSGITIMIRRERRRRQLSVVSGQLLEEGSTENSRSLTTHH